MTVEDTDPVNQLSDCGTLGWRELPEPISECSGLYVGPME